MGCGGAVQCCPRPSLPPSRKTLTPKPSILTPTHPKKTSARPNSKPMAQGNKFILPDYYAIVRTLGSGAYGVVCHAVDSRQASRDERRNVAVKKIGRAFEHAIDAKRTIREVTLNPKP
jgi:serine/threonine protein kinase